MLIRILMVDFRKITLDSVRWLPKTRKALPLSPKIKVQIPSAPCSVTLLPGRYAMCLDLVGHIAFPAFVDFVRSVENHAMLNADPPTGLRWLSCISDIDSTSPSLKLSAFDDAAFFDALGNVHANPTDIRGCQCLCEISGAWVNDSYWGLRWKVLEIKESPDARHPCLFVLS